MSRALNVAAEPAEVEALCAKRGISISTLEGLVSGGSRVVLTTMNDAFVLRREMAGKVLSGPVVRSGLFMACPPIAPHR